MIKPKPAKIEIVLHTRMTEFLSYLALSEGLSSNTISAYKTDLKLYQAWLNNIQHSTVEQISTEGIESFMLYLQSEGP